VSVTADGTTSILLVDDRPENLLALEAVLEPLNQRLVRATSGEEALRRLLSEEFAVILLDVQMPGLDGFDTAAHIKEREKTRDIPIIFITAISREPHHALRGYSTGAVDYIAKPFEPWLLQAKVKVFLELHEKNELLKRQRELLAQRLDERYRAEEALARQATELQRSNAELEHFAYVASHDLQQPLHLLNGYLDLLRDRLGDELPPDAGTLLDRAEAAARRMERLIKDLLQYSRVGTSGDSFAPIALDVVVDEAVADLRAAVDESGAEIRRDGLPTVHGSGPLLTQLFQNLIGNALKFRSDATPVVRIEAERSGSDWLVTVADNGIGIEADDADRIFSMFERLHSVDEYPGTGIGLAICRKIVEAHGGRIWVEPGGDPGTTFAFTLPVG
jgi:two-component system, sensor histidine kinase and response regulator